MDAHDLPPAKYGRAVLKKRPALFRSLALSESGVGLISAMPLGNDFFNRSKPHSS